jgi:hypothetical protein
LHGVASVVTEAWGLNGGDLESTTEFVNDQSGESLTFNVFGDEEERLLLLHGGF